jgi:hypothetical protein
MHPRRRVYDSLDRVATPAGARRDCTIRIDLGVLVEGIFPTFLKVNEGLPTPVLSNGIREVCQLSVHVKLFGACVYKIEANLDRMSSSLSG